MLSDGALLSRRAHNLEEFIRQLELGIDLPVVYGDFLDAFYHAKDDERQSFLDREPYNTNSALLEPAIYPYLAATVEKLAHDYNLDVPSWVEKPHYYLTPPNRWCYWSSRIAGDVAARLEADSPTEFSKRSIFVTPNALTRF